MGAGTAGLLAGAALAALVTGAGAGGGATAEPAAAAVTGGSVAPPTDGGPKDRRLRDEARFAPVGAFVPSDAVTYDLDLVPAGAWIRVDQAVSRTGTTVVAEVRGLRPGRAYGAHVHTGVCGADPQDAEGHYQHKADPVQPSTDPAYVNPRNEVWLDFTTDTEGAARAVARHAWGFRPGEAASVVIHGEQGGSGARLGCFSVPFASPDDAPGARG
ncbi:superoxide dismutase family protein [Streptomyces sp. SID8014]|uniref:superoxide dismutase family protein n=1 Tax=Streptomyces sp. SID8014 TaxID=2706097 RepID=UPI0013B9E58A|nr:superoxide dismutase family protein [Streptomyces sp. SID8014]NEC16347.1 superoxide dismutase family protein [Streptomyces sp. SID8014]